VADALDREHLQRVSTVEAEVSDDQLSLEVQGEGDLLLERWALRKKGKMFQSVFGLEVRMMKRQAADAAGTV
jgi:exopolyphosphatase/guanosine-5'-triphosphate,3'-diphosphate pyrophosphatase